MKTVDREAVQRGDTVRIRGDAWMTVNEVSDEGVTGNDSGQRFRAIRWPRISKRKAGR